MKRITKYQVYIDRGSGPELDGCWGSEYANANNRRDAIECANGLANYYADAGWLVMNESTKTIVYKTTRINKLGCA